jgi:hypothetical protein
MKVWKKLVILRCKPISSISPTVENERDVEVSFILYCAY